MNTQCNFDVPRKIFDLFCCEGEITNITKNNSGNINQTYIITTQDAQNRKRMYTLQKVNTYVFSEPAKVMENCVINIPSSMALLTEDVCVSSAPKLVRFTITIRKMASGAALITLTAQRDMIK